MSRNTNLSVLLASLVERLRPILPTSVQVRSYGSRFDIVAGGTPVGGGDIDWCFDDDRDPEESVVTAAYSVLSTVQDVVSIELREPWPPADDRRVASMLAPIVDVQRGRLLLSFGSNGVPVVELPPILLADIGLGAVGED